MSRDDKTPDRTPRALTVARPALPPGPSRILKDVLYAPHPHTGPITEDEIAATMATEDDFAGSSSLVSILRYQSSNTLAATDVVAHATVLRWMGERDIADVVGHAGDVWVKS